jgi:hypothetical protein
MGQEAAYLKAVEADDLEKVREFIKNGVDINSKDEYGNTALILAAGGGHTQIAKELIANKADLNLQNTDGSTALILALSNNNTTEIAKYLLNAGARILLSSEDKNLENKALVKTLSNNGALKAFNEILAEYQTLNSIAQLELLQAFYVIRDNCVVFNKFYTEAKVEQHISLFEAAKPLEALVNDALKNLKVVKYSLTVDTLHHLGDSINRLSEVCERYKDNEKLLNFKAYKGDIQLFYNDAQKLIDGKYRYRNI